MSDKDDEQNTVSFAELCRQLDHNCAMEEMEAEEKLRRLRRAPEQDGRSGRRSKKLDN